MEVVGKQEHPPHTRSVGQVMSAKPVGSVRHRFALLDISFLSGVVEVCGNACGNSDDAIVFGVYCCVGA